VARFRDETQQTHLPTPSESEMRYQEAADEQCGRDDQWVRRVLNQANQRAIHPNGPAIYAWSLGLAGSKFLR
jgi:hypothetical protein